ncbi:type III-B CRISPR module RAMP protein Cmr4 [Fervidobacterium thailandense]|uniref:Type III-B CRISPR module RAMP protein Cmr4 n=1 Tax=Fervidobacterium thailandense TaxID=1008305 RepID=A0A1E3G4J6_9BACT|nr:type III-B CRISPR module RAMP protein Cmr4 [Fervidobacterium thailandense]ODN30763.1 type III-B CRISPR module RAMP protein Cmr4 [Fervidobacterium thailandense]
MDRLVVTMYAESQLHAGKGMDIGIVDLPIQRERTTGFPIIQGVKGSLRANFRAELGNLETKIFGSEPGSEEKETFPGIVAFSEAKILLFPVRSMDRLFVWVTSPLALIRFFNALGDKSLVDMIQNENISENEALTVDIEGKLWLEEVEVNARKETKGWLHQVATKISQNVSTVEYLKKKMLKDIVVVRDEQFSKILEIATEVVPRISIDRERKTVKKGALWYEEYLPQDTVMYFVARKTAYANKEEEAFQKFKEVIDGRIITIGGKETVGKGLVCLKVVNVQ